MVYIVVYIGGGEEEEEMQSRGNQVFPDDKVNLYFLMRRG